MMVVNLDGARERRIADQAEGLGAGVDAIGLADKGHFACLARLCATRYLVDIRLTRARHADPVDVAYRK